MPRCLLISQCLQRDFIEPVGSNRPLPNRLHVGHAEATRLLGPDPSCGPVAQLMKWARDQDSSELALIHIRDWHDPNQPDQAAHLARFGPHCLQGSRGAELVLDLDPEVDQRSNERFVDSIALNDYQGTDLEALILELSGGDPSSLRVGVIGVWTEAKISFLLYDLATRSGIRQLATSSALTASASRSQHFNALEQLQRLLGVQVLDSVGAFSDWLLPGAEPIELPRPGRFGLEITGAELDEDHCDLIGALYRDATRVELSPLGGGFSGSSVYTVNARDALGHQLATTVLKLGERELIAAERVAFERVEGILGSRAPSVLGFVDLGRRAALKYAYAGMGECSVRTFKKLYESDASLEDIAEVLDEVFDGILSRFSRVARLERLPLIEHYGFASRWASGVRSNVEALGEGSSEDGRTLVDFYTDRLDGFGPRSFEHHYVAYIHGDLNGANILIDERDNVWLIDFFHTARGHVIRDLIKLENDLLFLFSPLADEQELEQARRLSAALIAVDDLAAALPESAPEGVVAPALIRAWATLRVLRGKVASLVREDRNPIQHAIGALRYSAHTLGFEEASSLQRRWALAAAAGQARRICREIERDHRLRIDWLEHPVLDSGRIGLTICPGRRDRSRDIAADLGMLVGEGVDRLVGLMETTEMEWAGVSDIAERWPGYRHLPIIDQGVPSRRALQALVTDIESWLQAGERVVIHCLGGLGRSGLVAAALLLGRGIALKEALGVIRAARGPRAVETTIQEAFLRNLESKT